MDGVEERDGDHAAACDAERIREVERYFDSVGELTADGLRAFLDARRGLGSEAVDAALCVHCAVAHPGVTAAVVDFLLAAFPAAAWTPAAPGSWLAPAKSKDLEDPLEEEDEEGEEGASPPAPLPLHLACANPRCPVAVILTLLERNPAAVATACEGRWDGVQMLLTMLIRGYDKYNPGLSMANTGLPLHYYLSRYSNIQLDVVKMLVAAHPAALAGDPNEYSPLEILLLNRNVDDFFDTVQFLLERTDEQGASFLTPLLHIACANNHVSLRVVKLLTAHSPESVDQEAGFAWGPIGLPVHFLLTDTSTVEDHGPEMLAALEHLIEVSPGSLRCEVLGHFPITRAVDCWRNPAFAKAILRRDPASALVMHHDQGLPLHLAATRSVPNDHVLQLLFDAHPEGIWTTDGKGETPAQLARRAGHVMNAAFLENKLVYARLAKNPNAMAMQNIHGQLPLHYTLCKGFSLGVIKLLAKADPGACKHCDAFGDYPLHHACRGKTNRNHPHCTSSLEIVKLLANGHPAALKHRGFLGDYPLHRACRARNYAVVNFLLGRQGQGAMALERNGEGKLPIELLCQSGTDRHHPEAVESTWLLLRANPEIFLRRASEQRPIQQRNRRLSRSVLREGKAEAAHKKTQLAKQSYARKAAHSCTPRDVT